MIAWPRLPDHGREGARRIRGGRATGYIGFDCTAKSLHVGSLVQIMNLRRLQQAGGKPIVLMGGGTTKIGDPTDKEKSRPILTTEEIAINMAGIKKNFEPFLTFGGPHRRDHDRQRRMARPDQVDRIPARLRQALHDQQDDRAGNRAPPARQ
jgi:tyrosyl-tRNA synthetase